MAPASCGRSITSMRTLCSWPSASPGARRHRRRRTGWPGFSIARRDADPAAHDLPVADDRVDDAAHQRHRNRESDALDACLTSGYRAVEADQLAVGVDQRAAGIAEVDR